MGSPVHYAVRRIQNGVLWRKILLRGAISYGQVYYDSNRNILVGKGFIRAYLLEQEAVFPRVIIDPAIIKLISEDKASFLKLINKSSSYNFESRLVYTKSQFYEINDDAIFVDYANKAILKESVSGSLRKAYDAINENIYSDQKLYSKYVWLRDYFLEILKLTLEQIDKTDPKQNKHKKNLENWVEKFERL